LQRDAECQGAVSRWNDDGKQWLICNAHYSTVSRRGGDTRTSPGGSAAIEAPRS
jgi:hypothetical protein